MSSHFQHAVHASASTVATIDATACKGCGGCASYCPEDAIDLLGSSDEQIRGMIDKLLLEEAQA